jgi:hypothetical protein
MAVHHEDIFDIGIQVVSQLRHLAPASHRCAQGSIPGPIMWDLVVNKVALGRILFEYFGFPCQISFHQLLHIHLSLEITQSDPGGIVSILGGHRIGHSKQNSLYVHASYSERFPR